ncbi:MAG: hypothetical protein JO021_01225, partial [Alphaproteobacteria bacterium]|nr:hypothetical protein [Alphaproteobacteria bacterium]
SINNPLEPPLKPQADKPTDKPVAGQPGAPAPTTGSSDPDEPPKDAVADYQLLRAVDLIKGISLYSNKAN